MATVSTTFQMAWNSHLGHWGKQWLEQELEVHDLDPSLLMWNIRRRVDRSRLRDQPRTTVQFHLMGMPSKYGRWWLVFEDGDVDLCLTDPGFEVDLHITAPMRVADDV